MIKETPELLAELKKRNVKIIEITLEDLVKAKPIYLKKDGKHI